MDEASVRSKMQAVIDLVSSDIGAIRSGRASPALVTSLEVSVYGGRQKLTVQELATISAPDTQTLVIDPWDKSIIGEIRQGILSANVGMNPVVDGEIIRISFPPLTTEDREKYTKLLATKLENGRIMVRQIRGEAMHEIKKKFEAKEMSEDEKFSLEKRLQEITDEFTSKIDEIGARKKQELLQI
ncbi:MAG: ribosome recycling factor [Patescibacteria group bacterium]